VGLKLVGLGDWKGREVLGGACVEGDEGGGTETVMFAPGGVRTVKLLFKCEGAKDAMGVNLKKN